MATPSPSSLLLFTMMSQGSSQVEAVNFEYGVPNIFPEFLIRLTFKLNISKKTEPK